MRVFVDTAPTAKADAGAKPVMCHAVSPAYMCEPFAEQAKIGVPDGDVRKRAGGCKGYDRTRTGVLAGFSHGALHIPPSPSKPSGLKHVVFSRPMDRFACPHCFCRYA
jgi:hypothetical protein